VCGVVFSCVTVGVAIATGVSVGVRTLLAPELVPALGWRIGFILGGLGGAVSFMLRRSLEESPEFARMKDLAVRRPFSEVVKTRPLHVLVGVATLAGTACFNGLFFSHLPAYLSTVLEFDPRQAVISQTTGVVASAAGILAAGWLAERIPPRYLLRAGVALLLAGALPFYRGLESRSIDLTVALVLAGLCAGLTNGSFAVLLTDLFPTRVRFTGVALVFNVAFTLFSGLSPLVATTLIRETGTATAPAWVMIASGVVALAGSFGVSRLGGNVLRSPQSQVASRQSAGQSG
jgi:MFS family permease